ncbi:hypothetical protein F4818DRAFT_455837 [Hypoxylon cercidicola]|nr:hypothetical protein F4818DRAFT_455837 [Hypoxylon cercidicola]
MLTPSTIPNPSYFYPLGNTPAVSLTRSLPQGLDADILLLGCGDVRNILFTVYSERGFPARKLDFTCCDTEPAVIARNIFLFTLLIDGISADLAWETYFDFRVTENTIQLIKDQAAKLLALSNNITQWNKGRYGALLRFCDTTYLRQTVGIWKKYANLRSDRVAIFEEDLDQTEALRTALLSNPGQRLSLSLTTLTSIAPLSLPVAMEEGTSQREVFGYYWKHGHLSKHSATVPNPLFAETLSGHTVLYYGTDPTMGFHLATVYAELRQTSPLRPSGDDGFVFKVIGAAKAQFREWVAAFREIPENHITLRFTISDALSFSHSLQIYSASGRFSSNLFRRQLDPTSVEFDRTDYCGMDSAPMAFDVIDTSNLAHHLGTLNLLVAAAPLLKPSASSTLWTETLLRGEKTPQQQFDSLLCGHAPTISLLLGLIPVEYWTNATSESCVDEGVISDAFSFKQSHSWSAWKLSTSLQQPCGSVVPYVEYHALSATIFQVYTHMLREETFEDARRHMALGDVKQEGTFPSTTRPLFHRGSFAAFMKHVQANISTDWPSFWVYLLRWIDEISVPTSRNTYRLDLSVQLHLQGLCTEKPIAGWVDTSPCLGGMFAWRNIPKVVCITVSVPREKFDNKYTRIDKITAPTFEGILYTQSPVSQSSFTNVHIAFGDIEPYGDQEDEHFSVSVRPDRHGWQGTAPVVVSYYVPSKTLQVNADIVIVGLSCYSTAFNSNYSFGDLGRSTIYATTLSDSSNVFVTKYEPGMFNYPFARGEARTAGTNNTPNNDMPVTTQITANMEGTRLASLCGHVDYSLSQRGKTLLFTERASVQLRQPSPFSIDIVLKTTNDHLIHSVSYPVPVLKEGSKTRIARTSGYIEVIVPMADPLTSQALTPFMYPVTLGRESIPVSLNSHQVNLDLLPVLDIDKSRAKANGWLTTLIPSQLSLRERALSESSRPNPARVNFKQALSAVFLTAAGLAAGNQTRRFMLRHPRAGDQILLFVRGILLHGAERSVVADAAVLTVTQPFPFPDPDPDVRERHAALPAGDTRVLDVGDAELALWKRALAAFAERCRTWAHGPACEYRRPGAAVPLSAEPDAPFLCSCGEGRLPRGFAGPQGAWDAVAAGRAVRVAISPTFAAPVVEPLVDASVSWNYGRA